MFTGIINHSGIIESFERLDSGARLRLRTTDDTPHDRGESVAVNGVCLTVLPQPDGALLTDVSNETLSRTTLGTLGDGARVNTERALSLGERLGGHLVQGHVDTVGTLIGVKHEGDFAVYRWSYPAEYAELIVSKGSIAVDGVSLTVNEMTGARFGVNIIPHTRAVTTLGSLEVGDPVNLEIDVIARYVARLMGKDLA